MNTEHEEDGPLADKLYCPACGDPNALVAVDRHGVVIDACSRCRGVWLDRGELDKLIALESAPDEDFLAEIRGGSTGSDPAHTDRGGQRGTVKHGSKTEAYGRKKRGGFLGDFFDLG